MKQTMKKQIKRRPLLKSVLFEKMPIVTLEQARSNILKFEQEYVDIEKNLELTYNRRKSMMNSCHRKIARWEGFIETALEKNEDSFKYRFSGVHHSPEKLAEIVRYRKKKPRKYTEEEMKERNRASKRRYAARKRKENKMRLIE